MLAVYPYRAKSDDLIGRQAAAPQEILVFPYLQHAFSQVNRGIGGTSTEHFPVQHANIAIPTIAQETTEI
ncbi:MAG: hypothetical protein ACE5K1_01655 [Acidiferrobacterales bacterium]